MELANYTCCEFIDLVASKAPAPGGGGVSALAGGLGIALGNMVGQLTTGKKTYAQYEEDIQRLIKQSEILQDSFLSLVDEDAEGFKPLAKAYSLPSSTDEEKREKSAIMETALNKACEAPMKIMENCCKAIDIIGEFAQKGSKLAVSDAGGAAIICKSALQSASLNVFINTRLMKNREKAEQLNCKTEEMMSVYLKKADDVYMSVYNKLKEPK